MANQPNSKATVDDKITVYTIKPPENVISIDPISAVKPSKIPVEEPPLSGASKAEEAPQPGPGNLPPADSRIAREASDLGLSVESAERDGPHLYIVVLGDHIEDVSGAEGRKLAYDSRHYYGWQDAGIEPYGGVEPITNNFGTKYRQTWKFTRAAI